MLTYGLLGAITITSAAVQRLEHSGRRDGRALRRRSRTPSTGVAMAARDEPLLERERAGGCLDERAEPVVGRGEQRDSDAECRRESGGHRRERLAPPERLRPHEVEPEVAVAEAEPVLAAELRGGLERVPGLVRASPPSLLVRAGRRAHRGRCRGRARPSRPRTSRSSPTLPIAVIPSRSVASTRPRRKRAAPTPPASTATFTTCRGPRRAAGRSTATAPRSLNRAALPGP